MYNIPFTKKKHTTNVWDKYLIENVDKERPELVTNAL